jgi:sulfate adenylyltransferase subunit 1
MDLVDFSEDVYRNIEREFSALVQQYGGAELVTIPVSALDGDNVVTPSTRTPWYSGPTLLEHLESVPVWTDIAAQPFRMAVQRVIRPNQNYRGFAGQIASGTIRRGDTIAVQPSGRTSRIASITTFDGDLEEATAPLSIALTLEDELDISRGDLLADASHPPHSSTAIEASLVWFDTQRLETHRPYLLKHGTATHHARITRVQHRTNTLTLAEEAVNALGMNDIGSVELELTRPLIFDTYSENRALGSFILIDPHTNATLAAGMIRRTLADASRTPQHAPALVYFLSSSPAIAALEQQLLAANVEVVRTAVTSEKTLRGLLALGLIVLVEGTLPASTRDALSAFTILDATNFASTKEIATHLLATHKEVQP